MRPLARQLWKTWFLWLLVCSVVTLGIGGWYAQSQSSALTMPERSFTSREMGVSIASDVNRALKLHIPVRELVGVPAWFADLVTSNPTLSGLALADASGELLFHEGLDPGLIAWLPHRLTESEEIVGPWLVTTVAVRTAADEPASAWLHVVSPGQSRSLTPWLMSWGLGSLAVVLGAWLLWMLLNIRLLRPVRAARQELEALASGTWPMPLPAGPHGNRHGAVAHAVHTRYVAILQKSEATLQKLNEVRAAHFDPAILARIDELAAPLLTRQHLKTDHGTALQRPNLLDRMSVIRRTLVGVAIGLGILAVSVYALMQLHARSDRNALIQFQQMLLRQSWQATLEKDRLQLDTVLRNTDGWLPWLNALSQVRPEDTPTEPVVPQTLPDGVQLSVLNSAHELVFTTATRNGKPQPDRLALAAMEKDGVAMAGVWQAVDRSFQSGVARRITTPDGAVLTVVATRALSLALEGTAQRMGAEVTLADLRDQPASKEPDPLVDAWLQGHKAHRQLDSEQGPQLMVSVALESTSGHTLGTLIARQALSAGPSDQGWGLVGLGWLALIAAAGGTLAFVRRSLLPVAQASRHLAAIASGESNDGGLLKAAQQPNADLRVDLLEKAIDNVDGKIEALKALRRSRERQGRRQARFIRHQMMQLASSLDDTARAGVLEDLERIEEASKTGHGQAEENTHHTPASAGAEDTRFQKVVDEVGILALGFQNLVGRVGDQYQQLGRLVQELREALRVKTQFIAIQQELEIARKMQLSILPHDFSNQHGLAIHGTMQAAKEVGGDFYDFFKISDHHVALTVADVSGKGIPAAFFMAVSRTLLRAVAQFSSDPAACLERLNDLLAADNEESMFVTLFYAVIDTRNGHVVYGNAGHNPPYVLRANGAVEIIPPTGDMALAIMEGLNYRQCTLQLHPGDALFMYTDGVTEACRADREMFGEPRLEELLTHMVHMSVPEVAGHIVAAIKAFEDGNPQADDITCLMTRYGKSFP